MGHFALSFIPILNIVTFYKNIYEDDFLQGFYECGVENCLNEDILNELEDKNIIVISDKNKQSDNYQESIVKVDREAERKKQIINDFKKENRSIEELSIIKEYIDNEIKPKQKVKTRY
jgi:hypothetical protein